MKFRVLICTAVAALGGALAARAMAQDYVIPAGTPAAIRAAVESDARPEEDRARDADRKPAEILTLSGIEPGDHVIEIAGFGNYYTRMLSAIVGDEGKVSMFDLPYTGGRAGQASAAFVAEHSNTEYHLVDYNDAVFPQNADIVFMILYYHDLGLQDIDRAALNAKLFDALKPGGVYLIVDHKAADGSGWRDTERLHRVGVEEIVKEVTAAGFELDVTSDLLAHPEDDHTQMVFTPGVRGKTDRAVFVFRKPD